MQEIIVSAEIKKTSLFNTHQDLGGKLVPFAGFEMPVWYSSLKEEHLAVRTASGCFDISHMGVLKLSGNSAPDLLQNLFTNDLNRCVPSKMVYGFVLNEEGMILDDVMIGGYEGDFLVIVNASNKTKLIDWITSHKQDDVSLEDLNRDNGFIAVQGPEAVSKLEIIFNLELSQIQRFGTATVEINGNTVIALRTGYTGEDGFELVIPEAEIGTVFKALVDNGVTPCGLAARDTLRLEKGLPLYGQELSESIHPYMTRYKWAVKLDTKFIGKDALLKLKENPALATVGLELPEKMIPRPHFEIEEGGEVTSGTLSPSLNKPIALAMVKPEYAELGKKVTVKIRNKTAVATVVEVPFT
ncbi:glycine cleavage system aminomethyltransferase GcvT [Candidatus Marinamargulisbacteria bacterium SCGC AAA071-K20]|nr:glycine cleavage system aminomethyltransferase GcvT [Candidatus Marinamargulisbacteria bacterium SCGC AAA071-K20]